MWIAYTIIALIFVLMFLAFLRPIEKDEKMLEQWYEGRIMEINRECPNSEVIKEIVRESFADTISQMPTDDVIEIVSEGK